MLLNTTGKPRPPTTAGAALVLVSSKRRTRRPDASSIHARVICTGTPATGAAATGVTGAGAPPRAAGGAAAIVGVRFAAASTRDPEGARKSVMGVTGLRAWLDAR